jgi:predicted DNA-binding transcriptional regulator AlpA
LTRRIIRLAETSKKVGLSVSQIWRLEQSGDFPGRVQIGLNSVGHHEDEIDDWIHSRIRSRGRQPPLPRSRREVDTPAASAVLAASPDQS